MKLHNTFGFYNSRDPFDAAESTSPHFYHKESGDYDVKCEECQQIIEEATKTGEYCTTHSKWFCDKEGVL